LVIRFGGGALDLCVRLFLGGQSQFMVGFLWCGFLGVMGGLFFVVCLRIDVGRGCFKSYCLVFLYVWGNPLAYLGVAHFGQVGSRSKEV